MLAPSMFYVHPERGLFATLGASNDDTKDFGNSINHCDWFGGRLYEPHFTAFPAFSPRESRSISVKVVVVVVLLLVVVVVVTYSNSAIIYVLEMAHFLVVTN